MTMSEGVKPRRECRTAADVMAALAKRHAPPAWALLEQVSNGTGWQGNRYADAVAMSLWPSRGLDLHGYEIKVYRNDWLRELANPAKAEDIASIFDYWWIAAVPGVVDFARDAIPERWGILELEGRGLVQRRPAPKLAAVPMDRASLAAILRRATERMTPKSAVALQIEAAREEGEAAGRERAIRDNDPGRIAGEHRALLERVKAFEAASGVTIESYREGDIGRAVRMALELGEDGARGEVVRVGQQLRRIAAELEKAAAPKATT